jgi:hypothetical protein
MPELYAISLGAVVLVLFALIVAMKRRARRGLAPLVTGTPIVKGGKTLVVLVHGTGGTAQYLACMHAILAEVRPDADVLPIEYPSDVLSNADTFRLSEQICQTIQSACDQRTYQGIIMVGYSKGALLIRKALVYGYGRIEDLQTVSGESRAPMPWVGAVERLVLLAGMDRGWTLRHRPKAMSRRQYWLLRFLNQFARRIGVASLLRQCESGEPFVANLRIQWLELMRGLPAERRPTVVQLLGDRDDVVSFEDQRDVTVAKDFIWVTVNNTGHPQITDLADPISGEERRTKIKKALGNANDIEALRRLSTRLPDNEDPLVHEVVVVLHGIRDMAAWTSQFEAPLQQAYQARTTDPDSKLHIT